MSAVAPLAVGTKGTIGSLVKKEIDYFNTLDRDRTSCRSKLRQEDAQAIHSKPASHAKTATSSSSSGGGGGESYSFGCFLRMSWRKKKKKRRRMNSDGGSFFPSLCSTVDVNEGNRFDRISGFNYRSLKADQMENL